MDEAENLFISRHCERLAGGQTDHRQNAVGSLPGSGSTGRHHQTRSPAPAEALCNIPDYASWKSKEWFWTQPRAVFSAWRVSIMGHSPGELIRLQIGRAHV